MQADPRERHDARRPRKLVYLDAPIPALCTVCGCMFVAPGEVAITQYGIAHVPCADDDRSSMRGGA